ncbi:bromodomain-containing protein DDB_G0270170-like isoform X2 [Nilaparvata lugens]|uniref:bromodomain-containing protein DDB_G0270170-like isoform X2 n=1 Tax=Nilaparvata lugens TaxID=108931 RepID=UPI00193E3FAF|nr:bromodomain-containing protein DDB_G0270170-like isoform X2 [Nilaparvata lugens]
MDETDKKFLDDDLMELFLTSTKLQKEFEIEKEDLNEQIRVINEIYEEKITKINDANLQKEFRMKNDWTDTQRKWEITRKEYEEKLDDEKRNIAALNAEKNDVIKATIKKYEEQVRTLRELLDNAKREHEVLEKRNFENTKIHEKKMEDLEKHYIKMMEDIKNELKPASHDNNADSTAQTTNSNSNHTNLAGSSNTYSNYAGATNYSTFTSNLNNQSNVMGNLNNRSNLAGATNTTTLSKGFSKFNQAPSFKNEINNQVGGKSNNSCRADDNKMAPKVGPQVAKPAISSHYSTRSASETTNVCTKNLPGPTTPHFCMPEPANSSYCTKNVPDPTNSLYCQRQIKPIVTSLSQVTNPKPQASNVSWSTSGKNDISGTCAAKKMKPLQSFPEDGSGHPLYAEKQCKVTFAPNLVSSAKEPEAEKRVQFPTNKRKL